MNPPNVTDDTSPSAHRINSTIAMVSSMIEFCDADRLFDRHRQNMGKSAYIRYADAHTSQRRGAPPITRRCWIHRRCWSHIKVDLTFVEIHASETTCASGAGALAEAAVALEALTVK